MTNFLGQKISFGNRHGQNFCYAKTTSSPCFFGVHTLRFLKVQSKLSSKCNFIAFFVKSHLLCRKGFCLLPRGEGVTQVTDEEFYPYSFPEPSHLPLKPSLKGKVANRRFDGRVLIFKAQIPLLPQLLFQ